MKIQWPNMIYVNGELMSLNIDYTVRSATSILFDMSLRDGDKVDVFDVLRQIVHIFRLNHDIPVGQPLDISDSSLHLAATQTLMRMHEGLDAIPVVTINEPTQAIGAPISSEKKEGDDMMDFFLNRGRWAR